VTFNAGCFVNHYQRLLICVFVGEFVEIIVFEGQNVKVWLKASQRLAIRNFLQRKKRGSSFTKEMQVCIFTEFLVQVVLVH